MPWIFLLFVSCEEETPEFIGESKKVIFRSNVQNEKGGWWSGKGPVAMGSHIDISIDGLVSMKMLKKESNISKRAALEKTLKKKYSVDDILVLENNIRRSNFEFETTLDILAMEKTSFSTEHLGAVTLTAQQPGTYPIHVRGIEEDGFILEFAEPTNWFFGEIITEFPFGETAVVKYSNFCMYPSTEKEFSIVLEDEKKRPLAWKLPSFQLISSEASLTVEKREQRFLLQAPPDFVGTEVHFEGKNVFGDSLYPKLKRYSICVAGSDSIQGIGSKEYLKPEFNTLGKEDLKEIEEKLKESPKADNYEFWTKILENKGIGFSIIEIKTDSDVPNFGIPITLSTAEGMFIDLDTLFKSERDKSPESNTIKSIFTKVSNNIQAPSGSFVVLLLPNKEKHKVTLSFDKYNQELVIQAK